MSPVALLTTMRVFFAVAALPTSMLALLSLPKSDDFSAIVSTLASNEPTVS